MNIESKVIRLEQAILGLGGLPKWATDAAEEWLSRPKYNNDAVEKALGLTPKPPEPDPISSATTVEGYAADLVQRFQSKENFDHWKQLRQDAATLRLKKVLQDLEAEGTV